MVEEKEFKVVIITDKKPVKYWLQTVLYDSILTGNDKIILSTIQKHQYIIERFLLVLLKMHGWVLDDELEENPTIETKEGEYRTLTFYKYHLIRDPYNKEIIRTELREKKNQEALAYLLDRLDIDRQEINEEEAIESLTKALTFFIKKTIKR